MWAGLPGPGYRQYRLGQLAQDADGAPRLGPAALARERTLISCRSLIYTFPGPPAELGPLPSRRRALGFLASRREPDRFGGPGCSGHRRAGPSALPAAWLGTLGPRFRAGCTQLTDPGCIAMLWQGCEYYTRPAGGFATDFAQRYYPDAPCPRPVLARLLARTNFGNEI
jgi:hypothetical protein